MVSANAVIVSADLEAQQALASLVDECGLAPIRASTVREAEAILNAEIRVRIGLRWCAKVDVAD